MVQLGSHLWIFAGSTVPFFTLPYSTRMTVVQLRDGSLWVHSPVQLTAAIKQQLDALGPVKYLVAPNALHHLFMADWAVAYPEAQRFGTQQVVDKRSDIAFHHVLSAAFVPPWADEVDGFLFTGSKAMHEYVFFHPLSGCLILTDLIENFAPASFPPIKRFLAKCAGILSPNGKTPLDWRLTFYLNKAQVRRQVDHLLAWQPTMVVMAHGLPVTDNATAFVERSFRWAGLRQ